MQPFDAYEPCGSCHRHVKRQDAVCPFCGAARTPAQPGAPTRIRNVSRAHWLAFGSTLVGVGCSGVLGSSGGSAREGASPDASTVMTAPATGACVTSGNCGQDASPADDVSTGDDDAALAEASPEASGNPWGGPDASCPRSGAFTCGSTECDRATQYCSNGTCFALSQLSSVAPVMDSGTCGSCPTCDCIPPSYDQTTCSCFEDNFGGLTVACSHGGCYGSPPARLERARLRA